MLKLLVLFLHVCAGCEIISFRNTQLVLKSSGNDSILVKISGCLSGQTLQNAAKLEFVTARVECLNQTIPVLHKEAVSNLYLVKSLKFSYNKLNQIKNYAFNNIPQLEDLDLTHNKLTQVEHFAFSYLRIKTLDLSYNNLKEIHWHMFKDLPYLSTFLFNYNQIYYVKRDWFTLSPNITKMELIGNIIWLIDNFDGVLGLQDLNLSHNNIRQLPDGTFRDLEKLHKLDLSYNNLEDVHRRVFKDLGKLSELWLQHNNLTYFDDETITDLFSLQKVAVFANPWLCPCQKKIFNWASDYNIELVGENSNRPMCVVPLKDVDKCTDPDSPNEIREIFYANYDITR